MRIKKAISLVLLLMVAFIAMGAAGTASMSTSRITQTVQEDDVLTIYYDLRSASDEPIKGAADCDVTVTIGDAEQVVNKVEQLDESANGCCYLFVVDTSAEAITNQTKLLRKAMSNWISDMAVTDYVGIVTFSDKVVLQTAAFSNKKNELTDIIEKMKFSGSRSVLNDAIGQAVDFAAVESDELPDKRVIILVSDGANLVPKENTTTHEDALAVAQNAGVPFYTVGLENASKKDQLSHLTEISEISGGSYVKCKADELLSEFRFLYKKIQYSYIASVTLSPGGGLDGMQHINLTVSTDKLSVVANRSIQLDTVAAEYEERPTEPDPVPEAPALQEPDNKTESAPTLQPQTDQTTVASKEEAFAGSQLKGNGLWLIIICAFVALAALAFLIVLLKTRRKSAPKPATPPVNTPTANPKAEKPSSSPSKGASTPSPVLTQAMPKQTPLANPAIQTKDDNAVAPRHTADEKRAVEDSDSKTVAMNPGMSNTDPDDDEKTCVMGVSKYVLQLTDCANPKFVYSAVLSSSVSLGRRAGQNDITIADPSVSGKHCVFSLEHNGILLRDLGSLNKTKLIRSDEVILIADEVKGIPVVSGDIIRLGNIQLKVSIAIR